MQYLHENVHIIHNDLKGDNILITSLPSHEIPSSVCHSVQPSSGAKQFPHHVVIVDFGKARTMSNARKYDLTETNRAEYLKKYPSSHCS